jgi:serine/threonine-protein kinase
MSGEPKQDGPPATIRWLGGVSFGDSETAPRVVVSPHLPRTGLKERLTLGPFVDEGGMCIIRRARDENLMRIAAHKSPRAELAQDAATLRQLIEEAQITAQLDHPNIVAVHELGVDDAGLLYFTMKLVRGRTLTRLVAEHPIEARSENDLYRLLQVLLKVCDAISFAHNRGVLHQDLKPDNVMVGEFGEVYVMDWGIARVRAAGPGASAGTPGTPVGTPAYMAPEQAAGDLHAIDERTDVFNLGAVLYHVLTGGPPYRAATDRELVLLAIDGEVEPPEARAPGIPLRLGRIAAKAMAWDPAHRYPTVAAFREEIESFLQSAWQLPRREFAAGEDVVRQGDPGDAAYIVVQGRCRVYRTADGKRIPVAELGPGDIFGEIVMLTRGTRTASVEAIDEVAVLELRRDHFEQQLGNQSWMNVFMGALGERFRDLSERAGVVEGELATSELCCAALRHLVASGSAAAPGPRSAPWSPLRDRLARKQGWPPDRIREALEGTGAFAIDVERDTLALRETEAE